MKVTNEQLSERITFAERNQKRCPFVEVDFRVRQKMSGDRKLDYRSAIQSVFFDDPDLHKLYVNSTPPLHHDQEG